MAGQHPNTTVLEHGIVAVDTEFARPLQDASHLIIENGRAAFVDTGVNSSVPLLMAALQERLYLTHYSEVGSLDRLAADMHKGINAHVAIALESANAENRTATLQEAVFDYFIAGLVRHGFKGDRDTMWSILHLDVRLNTQGIEVWLDKHG